MNSQLSLLDDPEQAGEDGWYAHALEAVAYLCRLRGSGGVFTTDAVWHVLDSWGVDGPDDPRLMGSVMRAARRARWAVPTDRTSQSVRVESHRRPVRVWRVG